MAEAATPRRAVHFGVFELNFVTGELRKAGIKIKLQDQPFLVLAMLLERPGELVTREELRSRLWPSGSFGDFDHGLNVAVKKLRRALSDSAENPRFIETLTRRGYRFVGQVEMSSPRAHARLSPVLAMLRRNSKQQATRRQAERKPFRVLTQEHDG